MTLPAVTALSPASGPPSGGTFVSLTGAALTGATAVHFGATDATSFAVLSATLVAAVAPAGTGTVHVTLTTAGGTSATSGLDEFAYADGLFTPAEAQAFADSGIQPLAAKTSAEITAAELVIRARFEAACRVAFIPVTVTETLDGVFGQVLRVSRHNPCRELPRQPLTVTAASIDGVALTVTELAALRCHPSGRIVRSDGSTWSSSSGYQDLAVSITYKHGWSAVPALVKRAGLLYCVRILNQGELPIGASGYTESGPPARFPYPGKRPHWTGDDEVDALLAEYEEDLAVVA